MTRRVASIQGNSLAGRTSRSIQIRWHGFIMAMVLMVLFSGCGTINKVVPVMKPKCPRETLQTVAREIEEAVQKGEKEPQIADREGVKVNTPEILQAIRTRAVRSPLVNDFLDTGFASEHANGLIYIQLSKQYNKATKRRQRDRQAYLIKNENDDRWAIYEGLINANHYGSASLNTIQEIFGEARLRTMKPGQQYKDANGRFLTIKP